jgi:hypothetical protein
LDPLLKFLDQPLCQQSQRERNVPAFFVINQPLIHQFADAVPAIG